ncbi:short chain dehydrogenase [[Kluyvera] intestini]|nr:short chain dehydrogenase [[Kluyvera] intestini]
MKILLIGASGTVGRAVEQELSQGQHDIIRAGRTSGDVHVDITSDESVAALFENVGRVDAIVATTGNLFFGPLEKMTSRDFSIGLQDKLLGQVRLALTGQHYLNEGGSITLTSGIVGQEPIAQGVNATTVNAALEGFVKAAACELKHGQRINVVSPTILSESQEAYGPFFPGFESVPAARVALAYRRSIEGVQTGRVYTVGY